MPCGSKKPTKTTKSTKKKLFSTLHHLFYFVFIFRVVQD